MEDVDLRKRTGRQLNRGESLHALRDFLFFANAGKVGRRQPEEQTDQALCLNLIADCVILWDTVYYQKILTRLTLAKVGAQTAPASSAVPAPP